MLRHTPRLLRPAAAFFVLIACLVPAAFAGSRPELDVTAGLRPTASVRALAARTRASAVLVARGVAASIDERYEVPSFLWATRIPAGGTGAASSAAVRPTPEAAARRHLGLVADYYRLQAGDVAGAPLRYLHDTGRGGIIAAFTQSVDGIDVFRDEVKVLMDRNLGLLAVSGNIPGRDLVGKTAAPVFHLTAEQALATALGDFGGAPTDAGAMRFNRARDGGYLEYDLSAAAAALPADLRPGSGTRVKKVLFHLPDALVPAWYVELMAPAQAYMYVVDATDGHLLFRHDLVANDVYSYRVWAETSGLFRPQDGPQGTGFSPHPTGNPDFTPLTFQAPSLVSLQNGPISTNDPWLPAGSTVTTGNNVDAYADLAAPDGFSAGDLRATTTAPNTFDRTYDVTQQPGVSNAQRMASVTQLFYDDNFLHDWFYDSGFNEAAGNGQTNNFGRGGLGSDALRAEAQDYSGTNNANMSTPADGAPGRMQMYVFTPSGQINLVVSSPPSVQGSYPVGIANGFGPQTFNVSGAMVVGQDGVGTTTDGCSALTNAAQVAGKIVLLDRSASCTFFTQAQNAQAAGAIGVVFADNVVASTAPTITGSGSGITIPVLAVTQALGNNLKSAIVGGTVNAQMIRQNSLARDGGIDNQVVAHEWGHFISNRLIGNASGLSTQMSGGLGEGWGDFTSMLLTVRAEDASASANPNWTGTYGVGAYALFPSVGLSNALYFGVRRVPYSTDFTRNGLTFHHIQNGIPLPAGPPTAFGASGANNAEVHSTGEVWCTMLWECYASLLRSYPFATAQQRMKDDLVAAYKLTPNAPTLLEARDALLAAALASDSTDFQRFWTAFARRGAGVGAVAPNRFDPNNAGVVESFVTGGDLAVVSKVMNVDFRNCDGDGYLDNGEVGHVTVTLRNSGSISLTGTTLSLSSANSHVKFPGGSSVNVPPTSPFTNVAVTLPVELLGASGIEVLDITATYNDPNLAVAGPRTSTLYLYGNTNEVPAANESVETLSPPWTAAGTPAGQGQWTRTEAGPTDHRFNGPDMGDIADHTLTSPPLQVSGTGNFGFSMQTNWDFERDATNYYDGGVIEISTDGGLNWNDIGVALSPPYGGALYNQSGNPLSNREAYVGQNPGYPSLTTVTASLGAAYQGQTVRLRFRVGCDAGVGANGWDIASITFTGLTNQPFLDLGPNAVDCTPLSVDPPAPAELSFSVSGANPASGRAGFRYGLPQESQVEIGVYDVSGRRVASLAHGTEGAGWHTAAWTVNDDGSAPASGIYFVRFAAGGRVMRTRVVMMR